MLQSEYQIWFYHTDRCECVIAYTMAPRQNPFTVTDDQLQNSGLLSLPEYNVWIPLKSKHENKVI